VARDRDDSGRPRNARPRDETGRPLERDASGVGAADETVVRTPTEVLAAAQGALDAGRPFAAHEYLEIAWHQAAQGERDLWQGVAQVAVGLTHLQRGNVTGAKTLLERGRDRLDAYAGTTPYSIDVDGIRAAAADLASALAAGETPEDPQLSLTLLP
jgi:hypothetical protein